MSKIEWTDFTANLFRVKHKTTGRVGWHCIKVTEGCRECYAEKMNRGFFNLGTGEPYTREALKNVEPYIDEELMARIPRMRKGRMIFMNSMTDTFADFYPVEWIYRLFDMMADSPQHFFQVLTKNAERMHEVVMGWLKYSNQIRVPDHMMMMCTTENQKRFDERIQDLCKIPARRGISVGPMLGPVDISTIDLLTPRKNCPYQDAGDGCCCHPDAPTPECHIGACIMDDAEEPLSWVIGEGESGKKARPCHPDWARLLRDNCNEFDIPFLWKQWGEWLHESQLKSWHNPGAILNGYDRYEWPDGTVSYRVGKKKAGRLLDGELWDQFPERKTS